MASFNKVLLMGNMTRAPEGKPLPSGTFITEFGLAANRRIKGKDGGEDRDEVLFVDCTAFGRTAEAINEHFDKGKPIFIEGRLKFSSWEDKHGGGKRSKLTVDVESFQFVGGREGGGEERGQEESPRGRQADSRSARQDERKFREADIPF